MAVPKSSGTSESIGPNLCAEPSLTVRYVKDAFLDWKVWTFAFMFQGGLMPVYCFSLFSPTLTANLGYTAATAQLVSIACLAISVSGTDQ
jgi:hypothetical protein